MFINEISDFGQIWIEANLSMPFLNFGEILKNDKIYPTRTIEQL